MNNQNTPPKEFSDQTTSEKGLDDAACSPSSDTPETDGQLDDARNIVLDYECRDLDVGTVAPVVVPVEFAQYLERDRNKWKAECKRQWHYLSQAIHNARAIQNIRWGHDGDCGADRLANLIEEDCHRGMYFPENAKHTHPQTNED